jgi:hypothetical protein
MIDTTVLMKTAKGFDEIGSQTPELPADLRMVLMMVNGLRNVAGLKVMNEELGRSIAPLVYLEDNGYIEAVPQRGQISLVPEEQMRQGASAGGGSRRGYGIMPLSPPPPPQPRGKAPEPAAAPKPSGLVRFFPQRAQPAPAPAAPAPAPAAPVARQIPPLSPPPPMQAAPVRREPEPAAYQPRPIQPPPPPAQAYRPPPPAQPAYQAPAQQAYQAPAQPAYQAPAQPAYQPPPPMQPAMAPRPMPAAPPAPPPPASPSTAVALHGGGSVQNTERVKQLLRYMARIMGPEAAPVLRKIQAVQTETEMNIMVNRLVTIVRYYKGAVESEQFANHFGP